MQNISSDLHLRDWRKARSLTQQQLADAIGRDKSVVSKLERGLSGITTATLKLLATALGTTPAALYKAPPAGTRPVREGEPAQVGDLSVLPSWPSQTSTDLPVYISREDGDTFIEFEPVAWIQRPEPLDKVANAFAIYVTDAAMEPAYRIGDLIFMDPSRPARPDDDVLVVLNADHNSHPAILAKLQAASKDELTIVRYTDDTIIKVSENLLHAVYRVAGKYNR